DGAQAEEDADKPAGDSTPHRCTPIMTTWQPPGPAVPRAVDTFTHVVAGNVSYEPLGCPARRPAAGGPPDIDIRGGYSLGGGTAAVDTGCGAWIRCSSSSPGRRAYRSC